MQSMTNAFYGRRSACRVLSVFLALLMALSVLPIGLVSVTAASAPLRVATLADLHYFAEADMGNKDEGFTAAMATNNTLQMDGILDSVFAALERSAKENGLQAVLIAGDLTYEGEKSGHEALAARLKAFEEETGLSVYVINGNHDINNSGAAKYIADENGNYYWEYADTVTAEEFKSIYADFGYNEAISVYEPPVGEEAGALSYSAHLGDGYRLIAIDAGKYSPDSTEAGIYEKETGGSISDSLMQWILAQLAEAKAAGEIPIGMTHWNLGDQNYFSTVALQGFVMDNWQQDAETLADAGMHFVFTGHTHDSDISSVVSDHGETLYNITTCSLGNYPNQYRETVFTPGADGSVSASFEKHDCDEVLPVTAAGKTYPVPFSASSFALCYGSTPMEYLSKLIEPGLRSLLSDIKGAGLVRYIEDKADFSLYSYFDELLHGGLMINNQNIVTAQNLMGVVNDIAQQIEDRYINDPDYTIELVDTFLQTLLDMQISEYPCSKFVSEYGFGSNSRPGNLGDLMFSIFVYKTNGNEDISDDPFMLDVLDRLQSGELVTDLIGLLRTEAIDKIIVDDFLSNINLNLASFFVDFGSNDVKQIINFVKNYASGEAVKKIIEYYVNEETLQLYNQVASEGLALIGIQGVDILAIVSGLIAMIGEPQIDLSDVSIRNIADTILGFGVLDQYGKSLDEVIDYFLNKYITDDVKQGVGYQLSIMLESFVMDSNPQEKGDYDVVYTYQGPVAVEATAENLRKPSLVAPSYGKDATTQFNFSWTTKYSVTGTDIEFYPVTGDSLPSFTGTPVTGVNVIADYEPLTREYYGIDFGITGFLPYEIQTIRHTITLTGLEPGTTYMYRIGSAENGWWSDIGSFTTSGGDDSQFTFFHMTDTQSTSPEQYENGWAKVMQAAYSLYPDARFVLHTGDFVDNGDNFKQWQWFFDSAAGTILNSAIMPVSGNHDAYGMNVLVNNFKINYDGEDYDMDDPFADLDSYFQYTDSGIYYSFDYNNAHFAILNSNDLKENGELTDEQLEWLINDMQSSDAEWKIVAFHKAVYSNGDHYKDDDVVGLRGQLATLMPQLQVDLVLNGHDHVYFRTEPLNNNTVDADCNHDVIMQNGTAIVEAMINPDGTIYSINGSAGVKSYTGVSSEETKDYFPDAAATYPSDEPIFTAITIRDNQLIFKSYAVGDNSALTEIDSFGIIKDFNELKRGDVDLNGYVNSTDARLALRFAVGLDKLTGRSLIAGDVDENGVINSTDARLILRAAIELEPFENPYVDDTYVRPNLA